MSSKSILCKCVHGRAAQTISENSLRPIPKRTSSEPILEKGRLTKDDEFQVSNLETEENKLRRFKPWQRLFYQQTLSGMRRCEAFKNQSKQVDELDLVLSSTYKHNEALFPDTCEYFFQPITLEVTKKKRERAKNVVFHEPVLPFDEKLEGKTDSEKEDKKPKRLFLGHPLIIGGIKERVHPCSVKLMNSAPHSPQTNAGYMRQNRDGTLFMY